MELRKVGGGGRELKAQQKRAGAEGSAPRSPLLMQQSEGGRAAAGGSLGPARPGGTAGRGRRCVGAPGAAACRAGLHLAFPTPPPSREEALAKCPLILGVRTALFTRVRFLYVLAWKFTRGAVCLLLHDRSIASFVIIGACVHVSVYVHPMGDMEKRSHIPGNSFQEISENKVWHRNSLFSS